jgi:2,3-bisphosphoglycerate-independent phosphoglycerate mutase
MLKKEITPKKIGPVVLLILDGWGIAPFEKGNAVRLAKTPVMHDLEKRYSHCQLEASGKFVGLPRSQRGNSEAGHLNLGAGRIIEQDVVVINKDIKNGRFFKNPAFVSAIDHALKHDSSMHLVGLISGAQSPHVEMKHVYALLRLLDAQGVEKVYLHLFTDGRDAPQHSSLKYIKLLEEQFLNKEEIVSISGRYYGMDRNKRWERTEAVYDLLTLGIGMKAKNVEEAILQAYNRESTDEFILPTIIVGTDDKPKAVIEDNDSIIFFNLRSDRARQLSKVFVQQDFTKKNPNSFIRKKIPKNLRFAAMTDFGPDLDHILTAYPSKNIAETLPFVLKDYDQLYTAETEKYAHVTYFFNGGYDQPVAGEERMVIPSPNVKSYAEKPEMSVFELTDAVIKKIVDEKNFVTVNFCNPDMIGHTGDLEAAIKGIEACDKCVDKVVKEVLKRNGAVLITADHGNAEEMINLETGEVDTEHSSFPVPFILVSEKYKKVKLSDGILADVAPTVLDIMGVKKPRVMTGRSLIKD